MTETIVPTRPPRDTRVDIVRGYLQLTIFASHAAGSWFGFWMIHRAWGFTDSSEQFVFLSGLMLGSVFALKSSRLGWTEASKDMLGRAWRLYRTNIIVFALFGLLAVAAGQSGLFPGETERLGWRYALHHPVAGVLAGLTTFYQPNYMDILPVFMWCMLVLPLFAWLEARVGDWALLGPIAVYGATQIWGLSPPVLGTGTTGGFDPFAWQILFLTGAWLGRRVLLHGRPLPRWRWMTVLAIAIVVVALVLRLNWFGFLPFSLPIEDSDALTGKDLLVLPRVLHAFALAWLVAVCVPREAKWMRLAVFRWLAAAGRFSLQVFCVGLFLSWGVTAAFRLWPGAVWWLDPLLLLAGCAILLRFGLWMDRGRARATARATAVGSVS
jgi:hypothetical protein